MTFIVQAVSSTVELVYQNANSFINVYPQYHQVGNYIYAVIQPSQWIPVKSEYQASILSSMTNLETIPIIQLVYTSTLSNNSEELRIFRNFKRIQTMSGKIVISCSIKPTVPIRIRFKILNRFDLAERLNRYISVGIGFSVDDDYDTQAVLTGYNPISQATTYLAAQLPQCTNQQSGIVRPEFLDRLAKLEYGYNQTFGVSNTFRIIGYASSSGGSAITTEYADYESVRAVAKNSWYQECSIESISDALSFTNAAFLFSKQQAVSLDMTRLYTQHVVDFSHMLSDNPNLKKIIGLEHLITDSAKDISHMFENNTSLTHVDLSHLRLKQVTNIEGLFKGCSSLTEINFTSILFSAAGRSYLYSQPDIFTGVPDDCHIIVADAETQVMIMKTYPNLTNVTTTS